jgi:hypothetical protein
MRDDGQSLGKGKSRDKFMCLMKHRTPKTWALDMAESSALRLVLFITKERAPGTSTSR